MTRSSGPRGWPNRSYLGTTARIWLNLQDQHDLDTQADRLGDRLDHEVATRGLSRRAGRPARSPGALGRGSPSLA